MEMMMQVNLFLVSAMLAFYNGLASAQTNVSSAATWCIAIDTVDDSTLQASLTYACGQGAADCEPIKPGGSCFLPNTVYRHASYVFNSYYQMHAKGSGTCSFGSTGTVTTVDPSNGTCKFPSSGSLNQTVQVLANDAKLMTSSSLYTLIVAFLFIQMVQGFLLPDFLSITNLIT